MLEVITKKRLFAVFRAIYFLPCGYTFFYLSHGLIDNYVGSKVIATLSESVIGEGGFAPAPLIAICSDQPYKNNSIPMYTIEDYMRNSNNVTDTTLIDYALVNQGNFDIQVCESKLQNYRYIIFCVFRNKFTLKM